MSGIVETMRQIQDDCKTDAEAVDRTPFTAHGIGSTFGTTLAMIAAVARAVELLADEVRDLREDVADALVNKGTLG